MLYLLALGFIIGMRHALEADHVAAVASLATRSASVRQTIRQGVVWGMGHTLTLFAFGAAVLALDTVVPERMAQGLELAVGVMLVILGADVLRRLVRDRVHFHVHRHRDGRVHLHAHSHAGESGHGRHDHGHDRRWPVRALAVGVMHGMAGSAALILLTLDTVQTFAVGLLYIALFGLGSVVGMALLSTVIAIPLRWSSARGLTWAHGGLQVAIGVATVGLGGLLVYQAGFVSGLLA